MANIRLDWIEIMLINDAVKIVEKVIFRLDSELQTYRVDRVSTVFLHDSVIICYF